MQWPGETHHCSSTRQKPLQTSPSPSHTHTPHTAHRTTIHTAHHTHHTPHTAHTPFPTPTDPFPFTLSLPPHTSDAPDTPDTRHGSMATYNQIGRGPVETTGEAPVMQLANFCWSNISAGSSRGFRISCGFYTACECAGCRFACASQFGSFEAGCTPGGVPPCPSTSTYKMTHSSHATRREPKKRTQ